jgi:hypothetical protein
LLFLGDVLALAFQFIELNDLGQVSFQQAFFLSSQLGQSLVKGLAPGLELLGQPLSTLGALQSLDNLLRMRKQFD